MLFMELVRLVAPASILQFFPVPLVLGVKDDGDVLQLQDEIRDKRALRPEIKRFPRERRNGFPAAAGFEESAGPLGHMSNKRLHPRFEELFHGHRPRDAIEIAEASQAPLLNNPTRMLVLTVE